jgi:hypothetical protein
MLANPLGGRGRQAARDRFNRVFLARRRALRLALLLALRDRTLFQGFETLFKLLPLVTIACISRAMSAILSNSPDFAAAA